MKVEEAINKILDFELDEEHYPELPARRSIKKCRT